MDILSAGVGSTAIDRAGLEPALHGDIGGCYLIKPRSHKTELSRLAPDNFEKVETRGNINTTLRRRAVGKLQNPLELRVSSNI